MLNRTRGLWLVGLGLALAVLPGLGLRASAAGVVYTSGRPVSPAVAFAPNNYSHLVVWAEDRGTGTGLDLYALRLSATGLPTGAEIPVIVGPGNQSNPALIYNDHLNQFLLVYTDDSADGSGGVPGVPTTVPPPIPGPTSPPLPPPPIPFEIDAPSIAPYSAPNSAHNSASNSASLGATIDTLIDTSTDLDGFDARMADDIRRAQAQGRNAGVLGRLPAMVGADSSPVRESAISLDGENLPLIVRDTATDHAAGASTLDEDTIRRAPAGTSRRLQPPPPPPPGTPAPTATPSGAPPPPVTPGSRDIHGVWLSTFGTRTTVTFPIVTAPSDDTFPDITYNPGAGNQYILVWREVNGVDVSIATMRMRGAGHFFYLDFKRTVVAGGDLGRPSVAAEFGKGEYLVAWSQTPTDEPARDIFGRLMNSNGVPYRAPYALAEGPADQVYPSLASLGTSGGYVLVWEERNAADPPHIKARRLNLNGRPYRSDHRLAAGGPFSFAPDVSTSGAFTTLVVWLDRNAAGDHSILAAEVNRDGRRLGPERLVVQGGAGPGGVTPVAPPAPGPTLPPVPPPPIP